MYNKLYFRIIVPIFLLMMGLGSTLYFVAFRTIDDFALQRIEENLEFLTHDLFNIIDNEYMQAIKTGRIDDKVSLQISQVDCLDILERKTLSNRFKLIVSEDPDHIVRMASPLPQEINPQQIIKNYHTTENTIEPIRLGDEDFYIRQFYFSPWKWDLLILQNTETYSSLVRKVHRVYIISILILLVTTVLFTYYLLYSIKTPISAIISSLSKGKSPGYKGVYEFEFLSKAISKMRSSLQKEVAERKNAEKKAEAASKAKSEFLANMSHELRTPLNAILGFAQIMERNKRDTSDEVALRIIRRSGNHLLTLINQILDLSRIEAGQLTITEQNFDLLTLLDELKSMLLLKASQKKIALVFDIDKGVPRYIRTDEIKLRQVLINLLSNAIKFTDEGKVTLRICRQKDLEPADPKALDQNCFLLFEVMDTGIGIAKEDVEKLFQAFSQATVSKTDEEGTGLGLIISKKFIELLGGKITLQSEQGQGSTFSFALPIKITDQEQTLQRESNARVMGLKPDQPAYRILVVDDKLDNRLMLVRLLEPIGFQVRKVENGQKALEQLHSWEPNLILMDIRMPVMDGITATKTIRTQKPSAQQPVIIAVTASVLQHKLESLLKKGFDDVIVKPFRENELFNVLKKHLDVEYIYDDEMIPPEKEEKSTLSTNLSPADFYTLPQETVEQLKKSISTLKMNETLDVIELIKVHDETLAERLQKLVNEYRFDTLQDILEQKN